MSAPRTIALDGPAGAGKTSVASAVARRLGYVFVDTGAFYRAVTFAALREGVIEDGAAAITALAQRLHLEIRPALEDTQTPYRIFCDGEDITAALGEKRVEARVSTVAAIPAVRVALDAAYRIIAAAHEKVIMAGRDIGTVVLPDADLKIYLDASLDVRAQRRFRQSTSVQSASATEGRTATIDDTKHAIAGRDKLDSERAVAPLRPAEDAHHILTDALSTEDVIAHVIAVIQAWAPKTADDSRP
ncbi:MAG TPA: (d)CMP kinase [Aggregatilineales bacterium]|nr:(d)CMP kinase [Anaerolineales bacterium]HRE47351.1 (d)CMP kinase [Aggregatilineales bacterium]